MAFSHDKSILSDLGKTIPGAVVRNETSVEACLKSRTGSTIGAGSITVVIELSKQTSFPEALQLFDALLEKTRNEFRAFMTEGYAP